MDDKLSAICDTGIVLASIKIILPSAHSLIILVCYIYQKENIQPSLRTLSNPIRQMECSFCRFPHTAEIREYLDRHQEITSFVALDDRNLTLGLDGHLIKTENCISEANVKQAIEILQREDGPFLLDDTLPPPN